MENPKPETLALNPEPQTPKPLTFFHQKGGGSLNPNPTSQTPNPKHQTLKPGFGVEGLGFRVEGLGFGV